MNSRHVIDIGGILVSAFMTHMVLSLLTLGIVRWAAGYLGWWRLVWDPPLAQFGLLICFFGFYTWFF